MTHKVLQSIQKIKLFEGDFIMDRRTFMAAGLAVGAAAVSVAQSQPKTENITQKGKFKLKYAPSFGMFNNHAGKEPFDNIKFAADQGFTAMFDNWISRKAIQLQEKIAKQMSSLDMALGPFIAYAEFEKKTFVTSDKDVRQMLVKKMNEAVEVAKRVNGKWLLIVPGAFDPTLEWDYQTANVIENLRYCTEVCEKSGHIIVIEPLNAWRDHPGLFLTKIPQAYMICRAVNSPACKIVDDIYHQQITEGNLIPNIDKAWSEIASFHLGDTPGRKEPGTGEINYKNIFKHLYNKGYNDVLCMEHGRSIKGIDGEKAVIEAYRQCDNF